MICKHCAYPIHQEGTYWVHDSDGLEHCRAPFVAEPL